MKIIITEKQLKKIIKKELSETGDSEAAPTSGTSSDGEVKTNASKWESGITRGPANQLGNTKWVDSYTITRGPGNQLGNSKWADNYKITRGKANPLK